MGRKKKEKTEEESIVQEDIPKLELDSEETATELVKSQGPSLFPTIPEKVGNRQIVLAYQFIIKYRSMLSPSENSLLDFILSHIRQDDDFSDTFEIDLGEYMKSMGKDARHLTRMKKLLQGLADTSMYVDYTSEEGVKRARLVRLLETIDLEKTKGHSNVFIELKKDAVPFLHIIKEKDIALIENKSYEELGLKNESEKQLLLERAEVARSGYTRFTFGETGGMRGQYSRSLFLLLKTKERWFHQAQNSSEQPYWYWTLGDGNKEKDLLLILTPYDKKEKAFKTPVRWKHSPQTFYKEVIVPAVEEINALTKYRVEYVTDDKDYAGNRKTSSIYRIGFKMSEKPKEIVVDLPKENQEEPAAKEDSIRDKIVSSAQLSDKELAVLLSHLDTYMRFDNIEPELIRDLSIQVINYYMMLINTSSKKTTTSVFRRLLNLITEDPKGYIDQIISKSKTGKKTDYNDLVMKELLEEMDRN